MAVCHVPTGQVDRGDDGFVEDLDLVVMLVFVLDAPQNGDARFPLRLFDHDGLEAPLEGFIFFKVLLVFLQGGRSNRTQFAPCQRWFEDVGGVHCAFSATGSHQRVDFVNKEDGTVRSILDFFDDCLQPLFKFPLVLGSSNQGTHVQAEQGHAMEVFRHIALDDAVSNSFGDGGFSHAGFADEERVVLGASA